MTETEPRNLLYETLEPVHIGAGGYRLGRVDKTICREPGTNLPKIPGTSLSGAARSYAALLHGKPKEGGAAKYDDPSSPIFYTFGHAADQGGGSAGRVNVGDARILLFPVPSIKGRLWVTCKSSLEQFQPINPGLTETQIAAPIALKVSHGLNLGWLWFKKGGEGAGNVLDFTCNIDWGILATKAGRIIVVPDELMSPIVNSNLEVRTSVAINPETGTAADGKLFSYEALPRETVMIQQVLIDHYENKWDASVLAAHGWKKPEHVLRAGLKMMETLGVGGMGTRGFGRMKLLNPERLD